MKLIRFWSWIKSLFKHQRTEKVFVPDGDPYAMIKHRTKTLGFRSHDSHNNRKRTKGRHIQYVEVNGMTKPIYHGAK